MIALVPRVVAQAWQYGELYLTETEADELADYLTRQPRAATVRAGQTIQLADLTVHRLPNP